jgi:hypothetical protein
MATNKSLQYKKELILAMEKCHGIVSDACLSIGVSRVTYYDYYKNDEDFKNSIDTIENTVLDYVEGKLFKLIERGDVASTLFYLKTKGKKRGYIERAELTGADGKDLNPSIVIELIDSSDKVEHEEDSGSK